MQNHSAGDINGDGVDDVVVGARFAFPGGRHRAGELYVIYGRHTPQDGRFPAEIDFASLFPRNGGDGSIGFIIKGAYAYDETSADLSAGDLNGDGLDDLIIGVPGGDPNNRDAAGETYVVFGRPLFPATLELSSLHALQGGDGSAGFVINGVEAGDHSGDSVASAGDVNGDGIDDLIIGAPGGDPEGRGAAGEGFVVFGRDSTNGGRFAAEFDLDALLPQNGGDGSAGFAIVGINPKDYAGKFLDIAGDINGDGVGDIIIGAHGADPLGVHRAGESYVVFGRDTNGIGNFPAQFELASLLPDNGGDGSAGFVLFGIADRDEAGLPVGGAGDINFDGIDDLFVSAFNADSGGRTDAGQTYVVYGRDSSLSQFPPTIELSTLLVSNGGDGSEGFVLNGIRSFDEAGGHVSRVGDVNNDGIDDLLMGVPSGDPHGVNGAGESYVVFGRNGLQTPFPAEFELASLLPGGGGDGTTGFLIYGADASDESGSWVSGGGDLDGDGIADLIIGASQAGTGVGVGAGAVYIVFGRGGVDELHRR